MPKLLFSRFNEQSDELMQHAKTHHVTISPDVEVSGSIEAYKIVAIFW